MSRRDNLDRCAACHLHATLCICDRIPRLHPRTRLALVIHHREARKPTNTGLLAARCLAGSTITTIGERDGHVSERRDRAGDRSDVSRGNLDADVVTDGAGDLDTDVVTDGAGDLETDVVTDGAGDLDADVVTDAPRDPGAADAPRDLDAGTDPPPPALAFATDEDPLLLYPADDAIPIADYRPATADRRAVLIVPDGSWRQAHKMRRRVPGLAAIPCVTLPDDALAPTTYRLRAEPHAGGLATLEAIARALRILEGDPAGAALEHALLDIFRVMRDRTLWLRGQLADAEVTGGLPQAAIDANPRGSPARRR